MGNKQCFAPIFEVYDAPRLFGVSVIGFPNGYRWFEKDYLVVVVTVFHKSLFVGWEYR